MTIIGDLERFIATSLYPLRLPIAIALLVALAVLIVVARRRGWGGAVRRHPGRSIGAAAILLVVGLPVAWYLGSPLFIRTALTEPAPSAGAPALTTTPTANATAAPSENPAATAVPAPENSGAAERKGSFVGADEFHFGSGTARLIETSPGVFTVRFEGFSVRNGPDLFVYLSPDPAGYADGAVELGTLKATDGDFNTDVPAGTDASQMQSVVIWCKQFAVQFAHASLD